ncbi:alternative oxidase [Lentinula raphanica]|uniref:Alternative oxidase n=1 Tax=Lentinula raphanica TaxID=153919 RepID=A0AA38PJD3_9AGAR|nr:mitochondrial alternative oxidase [Lentinula raphanica]KAJ3767880.1 alternative oxidase [Lentinula raphanica]KAJ3827600.1 alternative oxidase [Lentinula raphanica]KAJ3844040.1 alternative oxidase [Lentinula raphanica]KAJ3972991.1 alternative oxidase [Lentinula raphanica]
MLQHSILVGVAPQITKRACYNALLVGPARLNISRSFSACARRYNDLTDRQATAAAVGPHKHNTSSPSLPVTAVSPGADVSHQNTANHGDWVLFHPVYTPEELKAVEVLHREATCFSDKLAANLVKLCRWGYDLVSRYKHKTIPPDSNMTLEQLRKEGYVLDDKQWLQRILFLESIAGVPGMVAATLRHLQSLRLMRRDNGWIHTCLEEAENERMHLMTFMTLRNPSIFFRAIILGAQGVFYNLFFLSYLISPRACHRFVGHLEEEAVLTYTKCIKEIEAGRVPEWSDLPAPQIAIDYWRLEPEANLLDVIYAVRSDETTHRFVNHSLANLDVKTDVNPFALREPDMHVKGKKIAFERTESEQYFKETREMLHKMSTDS